MAECIAPRRMADIAVDRPGFVIKENRHARSRFHRAFRRRADGELCRPDGRRERLRRAGILKHARHQPFGMLSQIIESKLAFGPQRRTRATPR